MDVRVPPVLHPAQSDLQGHQEAGTTRCELRDRLPAHLSAGNVPLGSYTNLTSHWPRRPSQDAGVSPPSSRAATLSCHLFILLLVSEPRRGQRDLSAYDSTSVIDIVPFSLVNEGYKSRQVLSVRETPVSRIQRPNQTPFGSNDLQVNQEKILLGFSSADSSQETSCPSAWVSRILVSDPGPLGAEVKAWVFPWSRSQGLLWTLDSQPYMYPGNQAVEGSVSPITRQHAANIKFAKF